MAGVDALGGAVTWGELGSIFTAMGAFGTALFGIAHAKAKIEENSKQIEVLMVQMQAVKDNKAGRDELKDAVADIKGFVKDVRDDFRAQSTQVLKQIETVNQKVDGLMQQRTRAHST